MEARKNFSAIKDVHIEICLNEAVESRQTTGLEEVTLTAGFAGFSASEIDTGIHFVGKHVSLPLLISPLTGGGQSSERINRHLALAANQLGIGMAVGSQNPMLEGKAEPDSYLVRKYAPSIPLLANLGLAQVKRGREYLLRAVESIRADAIVLYVNPLQEILQEGGDADYTGVLEKLEEVLDGFPYPVLLKEVGFGLPDALLTWAGDRNIAGVDVAGLGGTNWARIEGRIRGRDFSVFEELGRQTKEVLLAGRIHLRGDQYLIASGGIRAGLDMAKALALGAHMVSMALPFLRWANVSVDEVVRNVEQLREELRVAMLYTGSKEITALRGKAEVQKNGSISSIQSVSSRDQRDQTTRKTK
ncbi:MAG: type 2 isopentenyl-diphosphate Delta-isomerase [Syntrophorhabdales bacterium]|jgi:isopentenyl-diphosphate delta-isomerase